ncbi:hypothetical protein CRYUN_Cryun01aG0149000 [Craigia yunnanensis]
MRLPLWPSPEAARNEIKSIWNQADFIKVSDDEVAFLTQGDPEKEDIVKSLWNDDFKLLIVTDGSKGCRYFTEDEKKLKEALLLANACAAISTTKKGAIPSLPDMSQAQKLIKY